MSDVVIDAPGGLAAESDELGRRLLASRRTAPTSWRGWCGVGGLIVCGAAVACGAADTPSLLPQSVRPLPAALTGVFGGINLDYHVGGSIALLALMMGCYLLVMGRVSEISPRVVLGSIAVLNLLMLLAPPLLSTDVFSYQAYARMGALYGINPYMHGPWAIRFDPVFPYVGSEWSYTPTVYGPVFTAFSYLFAHLSVAASVIAYKLIAFLSSIGLVAIVWRAARLREVNQTRAVALVGLNPLLVVFGVGAGHNDLLMLLALGGGVYALLGEHDRRGGALLALAVALKLTAVSVAPFALAAGGRDGWPRRRRIAVVGLGICLLAAVLSVALFGSDATHMVTTLAQNQKRGDSTSIPGAVGDILADGHIAHYLGDVLTVLFAGASAWLFVQVCRGRMDWLRAAAWATFALLVAAASLLPWYVSWLLPLAALCRDGRLHRATLALSGVVLAITLYGFLPHGL